LGGRAAACLWGAELSQPPTSSRQLACHSRCCVALHPLLLLWLESIHFFRSPSPLSRMLWTTDSTIFNQLVLFLHLLSLHPHTTQTAGSGVDVPYQPGLSLSSDIPVFPLPLPLPPWMPVRLRNMNPVHPHAARMPIHPQLLNPLIIPYSNCPPRTPILLPKTPQVPSPTYP
jgi:hypothetical protein